MTTLAEAARQALEALEEACGDRCNAEYNPCYARTAITALRQALANEALDRMAENARELGLDYDAKPDEPVAYVNLKEWVEDNGWPDDCFSALPFEHLTPLYTRPQPADEPVAKDWSVFNTGAEVWSGLSLEDAVAELTPDRLDRGWSAVCVINKDNPPVYTRTQPAAPEQPAQRWAVFCGNCRKEWSVPYPHPGKSICADCGQKGGAA